ncbi:MAG: hypothetical protein EOP22_17410 [Hyphomicrobiales bacterium]|nr:MAG: hypothetical protein EOP22_17410 [Hyphomicrobiales bacterium]
MVGATTSTARRTHPPRHSRAGGNPGQSAQWSWFWIPACAGMTFGRNRRSGFARIYVLIRTPKRLNSTSGIPRRL